MNESLKKVGTGVALVGAFALGGAAVAGAVQNNSTAAATTTQAQPPRPPGDEQALTGETAEKVRAAALAEVPGATVDRLETDAHGNAAYEAHLTTTNGEHVTVYVNADFQVVGTDEGRGPGQRGHGRHGGPGGHPNETELSGQTAQKVRAAAVARVPGGTVERLETDGDGNAAYEAHMRRADGTPVIVYVNKQFQVVKVEEGR